MNVPPVRSVEVPTRDAEAAERDPMAARLEGDRLFDSGEFAAAEVVFERLLENGDGLNWCYFQLGRIAARQARWEEAIAKFDKALGCEEPIVWAHFEKALALRQCSPDKSAWIAELVGFVRLEPNGLPEAHYPVLLQAAHEAFDARAYQDALSLYEFVGTSGYGRYICKLRCADIHLLSGDAEAALRILDEASGDSEDQIWGDLTRARALLALGRFDEEAALSKTLAARAPDNADIMHVLLTALEGAGEEAELAFFEQEAGEIIRRPSA